LSQILQEFIVLFSEKFFAYFVYDLLGLHGHRLFWHLAPGILDVLGAVLTSITRNLGVSQLQRFDYAVYDTARRSHEPLSARTLYGVCVPVLDKRPQLNVRPPIDRRHQGFESFKEVGFL
jgi:hypothetical protein